MWPIEVVFLLLCLTKLVKQAVSDDELRAYMPSALITYILSYPALPSILYIDNFYTMDIRAIASPFVLRANPSLQALVSQPSN